MEPLSCVFRVDLRRKITAKKAMDPSYHGQLNLFYRSIFDIRASTYHGRDNGVIIYPEILHERCSGVHP